MARTFHPRVFFPAKQGHRARAEHPTVGACFDDVAVGDGPQEKDYSHHGPNARRQARDDPKQRHASEPDPEQARQPQSQSIVAPHGYGRSGENIEERGLLIDTGRQVPDEVCQGRKTAKAPHDYFVKPERLPERPQGGHGKQSGRKQNEQQPSPGGNPLDQPFHARRQISNGQQHRGIIPWRLRRGSLRSASSASKTRQRSNSPTTAGYAT